MSPPFSVIPSALACCFLSALPSCSSRDNAVKIHDYQEKSSQLKLESDQLAAEAASIQQKIRDAGSAETTGEAVVVQLGATEKQAAAEGARLEKLAADLKQANATLAGERKAFTGQYLKP